MIGSGSRITSRDNHRLLLEAAAGTPSNNALYLTAATVPHAKPERGNRPDLAFDSGTAAGTIRLWRGKTTSR
jgi:hypothetical protein